jgi:DNA-binding NarL/FixJ family response regulator
LMTKIFSPMEYLRRHGYDVTHFRDIDSLDSLSRYAIILCDLVGVGSRLSPTQQGAHVIEEIKKHYPEKVVIAYTGGARPDLLGRGIPASDYYLPKDANVEQWCESLDNSIRLLGNPVTVWKKLRHRLLDAGVTPYQLAELEDTFVRKVLIGEEFTVPHLETESARLKIPPVAEAVLKHLIFSVTFEIIKDLVAAKY